MGLREVDIMSVQYKVGGMTVILYFWMYVNSLTLFVVV